MSKAEVSLSRIPVERESDGTPEITDIHYDLWVLRVTLAFEKCKNPTYVHFEAVEGFRVLDEGQLLEFWGPETEHSWLYTVEKGGWIELEQTREGSPILSHSDDLREYLVAGINDCVSVIAYEKPSIFTTAP